MPPRTGSTSLTKLLNEWGAKLAVPENEGGKHCFIKDAIKRMPELAEYKFYGFMRNPVDRYVSLLRYLQQGRQVPIIANDLGVPEKQIGSTPPSTLHRLLLPKFDEFILKRYFIAQTAWLNGAELLNFENYDLELLKIARLLGKTRVTIPRLNGTIHNETISDDIKDFVRHYYADDCALWKERFGRETA